MPFPSRLARFRLAAFGALRRVAAWVDPRDRERIVWRAYRDAGAAFAEAGRYDEADAMLARGLAAFPDDGPLLIEHALSAHHAGRHAEAAERWETALRTLEDEPMCYAGLCANLRTLGDYDTAQAAIDEGLRRTPKDLAVVTEAARLAFARDRFRDALAHWRTAVATRRPHPDWLQGHAQSLVILGAFGEAEAALRSARASFPDHAGLEAAEGTLLSAREDWPRAIAFWTTYRRRHPDDPTGWQQVGIAVQGGRMSRCADPAPLEASDTLPAAIAVVEDEATRRLMLRFESIGDNCEFGLVQRRYAAEPLGLLRWNTVAYDGLMAALAARFAGMGEADNTEIVEAANGEFFMRDRRWHLGMHTFLYAGQTDRDALHAKMCRRIVYLRDKLLADLTAAEKVFVYRSAGLDGKQLAALHGALRAIGPVTLLAVQPVTAPAMVKGAPGDAMEVADGRWVGFVARPGADRNGNWDIAFGDWTAICRTVVA